MYKIERELKNSINPLVEFLGPERVELVKDKVVELLLNKIENDLEEATRYQFIIDDGEVSEIVSEAINGVKEKIKQKLEDKYMALAEEAISKIRIEE